MAGNSNQGFKYTDSSPYVYQETTDGGSVAYGPDASDGDKFKINSQSTTGAAIPPGGTPQVIVDPATNGNITLTPNGTGNLIVSSLTTGLVKTNSSGVTGNINGTNGQVVIASTAGSPAFATITSSGGTITFTPGANSLNMEAGASVATTYDGNSGSATPALNTITIEGDGSVLTSTASGSSVTFSMVEGSNGEIPIAKTGGSTIYSTITPGTGISISNAANSITIATSGAVSDSFATDSGTATPALGVLTVHGGHDMNTSGSGSTVTVAVNNNVTLGDLSVITSGNDALTAVSGNITLSGTGVNAAANINLPNTNTGGTQGEITFGSTRWISNFGTRNTFVGQNSGNTTVTGNDNIGLGYNTLNADAAGGLNIAIGSLSCQALTSGSSNTAIGASTVAAITSGSYNTILGYTAGSAYGSSESSNIIIGNAGVGSESHVIRIGTTGSGNQQQSNCYIAGINGVNVGSVASVVSNSGDQLGSTVITAGSGITVTPGANTITIAASSTAFPWQAVTTSGSLAPNNGYIANSSSLVTLTLPAVAAFGSIIRVVNRNTGGFTIAQNSGQQVLFGSASTTSGTGGSLSSTLQNDCVELLCELANTNFIVLSSVGNLAVV